jgi:hypothetical protein
LIIPFPIQITPHELQAFAPSHFSEKKLESKRRSIPGQFFLRSSPSHLAHNKSWNLKVGIGQVRNPLEFLKLILYDLDVARKVGKKQQERVIPLTPANTNAINIFTSHCEPEGCGNSFFF